MFENLKELYTYRELLMMLTWKEIRVRYKQSVTGFFGPIFMPIIFDTSTERLGNESATLEAGERLLVTFELDINFAFGTFYLAAILYRYDEQKEIDSWSPAATIYVSTSEGVRGVVNCHPRVLRQTVVY